MVDYEVGHILPLSDVRELSAYSLIKSRQCCVTINRSILTLRLATLSYNKWLITRWKIIVSTHIDTYVYTYNKNMYVSLIVRFKAVMLVCIPCGTIWMHVFKRWLIMMKVLTVIWTIMVDKLRCGYELLSFAQITECMLSYKNLRAMQCRVG